MEKNHEIFFKILDEKIISSLVDFCSSSGRDVVAKDQK
jgi:hypothetical protein